MSLGRCLTDLRDSGEISAERYAQLEPLCERLIAQYEPVHGRAAAESLATEKVLDLADAALIQRKRHVLLQHKAQGAWLERMQTAARDGLFDRRRAEDELVAMDNHRRSIRQQALQMIEGILSKHRRDLLGRVREQEDLADTLAEVFGRDTGNLNARELADAWRQTGEWLRSRFNAAGGHIAKLDSWNMPQRHDMGSVREAGFAAWRDFLLPLLDRTRMIDRDTGEPFTDARLDEILSDMWEAIATDGWSRNNPGAVHVGAVANRRADHRVLHFAGPEEWAAYAERFGGAGTAFDAMLSHVESMARDIAAMERMGPNPAATLRFQQDWLQKSAAEAAAAGVKIRRGAIETVMGEKRDNGAAALGRLFDEYTGEANRPERMRLAMGFSIFRAQQTAAKLGGAALSVGGDFGTMATTARFNGLPASKVMKRYASMINPANTADRAQAARTVLMADQWAEGHAAQWRSLGEELAHEGAQRMASGVLRASGLTAHTDIARQAFAMEAVAHVTHMRDRGFDQLDPAFRGLLQRYDIDEARWDTLRSVGPESYRETDWLYPQTVAGEGHQALADDFMRLLVTEADYAVPVPDLRTRALINARAQKGTLLGEVIRSGFLFKGFPLTILNMHGRRMIDQGMSRGRVAGYVAGALVARYGLTLLTLTTLGGAISLQAKQIAKGQDPLPMGNADFWAKAMLQGGGLGIFGDFIASAENRFGGGFAQTLVGPLGQTADNLLRVAGGVKAQFDDDEGNDDDWRKAAARLLMSETPGLSLWYGRLAVERTLGDMVSEWTYGEDVGARYRRLEGYAAEQGTAYYAPPGGGFEWRAPNWGNALGDGEADELAETAL